jgi:hypothetical protein
VLNDQELIDGLRRELADVQPPIDLIDRLREHSGEPLPVPGRRLRVPVGFFAAAGSAAVAIAITVGALVFVGHRTPTRNSGPDVSPITHGTGATTLTQLTSSFAVLRRPETPADRALRFKCSHPCPVELVPGLTRLARTLPDGTRVFLSVLRARTAERTALGNTIRVPAGSYMLDELVVSAGEKAILSPGSLAQIPVVDGGIEPGMPSTRLTSGRAPLWVGVVPDGVSSVRWGFSCIHGRKTAACPPPATITATVTALDNVAAAPVSATRHGSLGVTSASWFDAARRSIASFSTANRQTTMRFIPGGLVLHSRLTFNGDGLGPITFGASPAQIARRLYPILGRPGGTYHSTLDACGVDHSLTWPILLNPSTGQLERGEELTVFFHRDQFVGYQYGGNAFHPHSDRLQVRAITGAGLAIGDTLATGQRLYRHAFHVSTAQGGTWQASTPHGKLTGYASGTSTTADVGPSSRVASIDAGDVGCPVSSP